MKAAAAVAAHLVLRMGFIFKLQMNVALRPQNHLLMQLKSMGLSTSGLCHQLFTAFYCDTYYYLGRLLFYFYILTTTDTQCLPHADY